MSTDDVKIQQTAVDIYLPEKIKNVQKLLKLTFLIPVLVAKGGLRTQVTGFLKHVYKNDVWFV